MSDTPLRYAQSAALFERARQVIPGGIYGHMTPALVAPGASPFYAQRGEGCRYWDVDGNEYLDLMCAYGPVVLGYLHPEVEEAVARQLRAGDCFNHPGSVMVELAEQMVELVDFAAWAVFAKNGSDVTSWSIRVAREHTGRRKVLIIDDAYHGMDPWCSPGHGGLIEEDRATTKEPLWLADERLVATSAPESGRGSCAAYWSAPILARVLGVWLCEWCPGTGARGFTGGAS